MTAQPALPAKAHLADFDSANSPDGLMLRYASGRVTHFLSRQILTLSGTASLMLIASPAVGLLAMALALLGEAVDCLVLRHLPLWIKRGASARRMRVVSTLTALFQSLTIAACVAVAWFSAPPGHAAFFCVAYLSGAALNAGIVLPFHPAAARVRLAVYGMTGFGLYGFELLTAAAFAPRHGYDLMALLIMSYLVHVFVSFVASTHARNTKRSREMLVAQRDLQQMTLSLHEREREARRLSLIAQTARDSIFLTDAQGRITWTNDAFTHMTGYDRSEVLGHHPGEVLNGPDTDKATIAHIAERLSNAQPVRVDVLNYTKDGRKIWVDAHVVPVPADDLGDAMCVSVERDITEAKENARNLAQATLRAEAASRAKSEFLATMSHEIRTPMNGVMGMADLLSETSLNSDQRLYAETIRSSAQALLTIINDILDLSRLEAGRMTVDAAPVPLEPCLRDVVTILSPLARDKGLKLMLDIDASLPAAGLTDGGRLRQVLMNLVGNAVKFTTTGAVKVIARPDSAGLAIDVQDSGIGISADRLADIFEAFQQEDGTITRRFGGTGLGLTISRQLARLMGGDISVMSRPGIGSTFTLTLSFDPCSDPLTAPDAQDNVADLPTNIPPLRVLVAEDNRTNRLLIGRYLKGAPCDLTFAEDGAQAVSAVQDHPPDLIFMDMSMPGMDGLEATRAIRAAPIDPQPMIVALTANAFAEDRDACLAAGMNDFLTKPVKKSDLIARVISAAERVAAE